MKNQQAKELLAKYEKDLCTPEEKALVESWFIQELAEQVDDLGEPDYDAKEQEIFQQLPVDPMIRKIKVWPRIAAAASILLGLSIGGYFLLRQNTAQQTAQIHKQDIAPGGNKAILTLVGGQQIILTGAKNGLIAHQGSAVINKTANGQVVYSNSMVSPTGGDLAGGMGYNIMTTPRGGQYHLTLADGSEVWLNSASSIRYPTAFAGKDRQVEITGEAYFEVAHNAAKPFRVIANGQVVEVLGTHFNINAYADEPAIKTVLLEGSVKVTELANHTIKFLKPGQQVILDRHELSVSNADVEATMAWKNGYFRFHDEQIESVMRKIARWYDINVRFEGMVSEEQFNGKISRYKNISQVLKMLEETKGVHFKVSGKEVTVMQ